MEEGLHGPLGATIGQGGLEEAPGAALLLLQHGQGGEGGEGASQS